MAAVADQTLALVQQHALRQVGRLVDKGMDATIEKGAAVLGWLKGKLTGKPKAALEEVEKDPEDPIALHAFGERLRKALAEDQRLLAEPRKMLPPAATRTTTQQMNITGSRNIGIQAGRDVRVDKA
ncbi:MAG: hypothetical protein V2A79_17270 [Planctomycetota bacterium]